MDEQTFEERLTTKVPGASYVARRTMNQMDRAAQEANEKIEVFVGVLKQLFAANGEVVGMLDMVWDAIAEASNEINSAAERFDAQYRDDEMPWPEDVVKGVDHA